MVTVEGREVARVNHKQAEDYVRLLNANIEEEAVVIHHDCEEGKFIIIVVRIAVYFKLQMLLASSAQMLPGALSQP